MRKIYIKPEIIVEDIELCDVIALSIDPDGEGDAASKDREDFEGEGDSGWGALW